MKRQWETEELIEHWTLHVEELALLGYNTGATRRRFAVLLKFFQIEAGFPAFKNEVPGVVITYLATQGFREQAPRHRISSAVRGVPGLITSIIG
jgi:hypothetical protein